MQRNRAILGCDDSAVETLLIIDPIFARFLFAANRSSRVLKEASFSLISGVHQLSSTI